MKRKNKHWFFCFVCLSCLFLASVAQAADIVEGQAIIDNRNIPKAREEARRDAMRSYVENKLGVHVESATVVVNNLLVTDHIMAKSDGYISVKRILKEWQKDGVFFIQLELEANEQKIKTAPEDLKGQLDAIGDNTNRSGIQVAIIGVDEQGHPKDFANLNRYFQGKLAQVGFHTIVNDDVLLYMSQIRRSGAYQDQLQMNTEIRRISRNTRSEENAIIRGELSTIRFDRLSNGYYKALVNASFEMIGLDSNQVDTFVEYFEAVGKTHEEAERKALEIATQKAAVSLGALALETVQSEYRGGVRNIKTTMRFAGITDRIGQRQAIIDALKNIGCKVIRSAFTKDGFFQVFLETSSFSSQNDLVDALLQNVQNLQQGVVNEEELGASKLDFTF